MRRFDLVDSLGQRYRGILLGLSPERMEGYERQRSQEVVERMRAAFDPRKTEFLTFVSSCGCRGIQPTPLPPPPFLGTRTPPNFVRESINTVEAHSHTPTSYRSTFWCFWFVVFVVYVRIYVLYNRKTGVGRLEINYGHVLRKSPQDVTRRLQLGFGVAFL